MATVYIRVCAVLIGLRSLTNLLKFFSVGSPTGDDVILVFFGQILRNDAAAWPALILGTFMLATAASMWKPMPFATALISVYAAYVLLNMLMWTTMHPEELVRVGGMISSASAAADQRFYGILGMTAYAAIAIATTVIPAMLLRQQRH